MSLTPGMARAASTSVILNARMGMRAAQYEGPQAALWRVVVGIATAAGEEPHVLDAAMGWPIPNLFTDTENLVN